MEFRIHKSGLHYYNSHNKHFVFINPVSGNKVGYTQRHIKRAEFVRTLYTKLCYLSWKDFKWVIRSNQIKDFSVTVEDVNVSLKIWGKNIAALKGNTTRRKPNTIARDSVKILMYLMKLHKEVFLTLDIFCVNNIPLFFTLIRKICFTSVNRLANHTVLQIFAALKEIYQY